MSHPPKLPCAQLEPCSSDPLYQVKPVNPSRSREDIIREEPLEREALWLLAELAAQLSQATTLANFCQLLSHHLRWLFDYDRCTLAVRLNPQASVYNLFELTVPTPTVQFETEDSHQGLEYELKPSREDWPSRLLVEGKPYFLSNLAELPPKVELPVEPELGVCQKATSLMLLPLRYGQHVLGALLFSATRPNTYTINRRNLATVLSMQLSGQLGSILAQRRTQETLQALQSSRALNLFLAEKRLTGEIALAFSHRLNNLLAQSISYLELAQFSLPALTELVASYASQQAEAKAEALVSQLHSDLLTSSAACQQAVQVIRQVQHFKHHERQSAAGLYNWLEIVTEGVNQAQELFSALSSSGSTPGQELPQLRLENHLKAEQEQEQEGGWVRCEPNRAIRAVVSLVKNALEACPPHRGKVLVEIKLVAKQATQAYLTVSITDNGTGLSDEAITKLYQPFFTTKAKAVKKPNEISTHLGLELALVQAFALNAGGWLEYQPVASGGACFTLALPLP